MAVGIQSSAQIFWDSVGSSNLQKCLFSGPSTIRFTVLAANASGSTITVKIPQGIEIASVNSVFLNGSSVSYSVFITGGNRLVYITLGAALTIGDAVLVNLNRRAYCGANNSSSLADTVEFNGTGSTGSAISNNYNILFPSFSISNVGNNPNPVVVGSTNTRKFTITNSGFGSINRFFASDDFLNNAININSGSFRINPSGVNYSVPVSQITNNADSVRVLFSATQIQQIGDGDTLFENGESFELSYSFTVANCGASNLISSTISSWWGCSNSVCQRASLNSDFTVPNTVPNIIWNIHANRINACWNNYDTIDVVFWNNSSNLATQVEYSIANGSDLNHLPSGNYGVSRIDTSKILFKRGNLGVWVKPTFSNYEAHTAYATWNTGITGAHRVDIGVGNLAGGDTIYMRIPYYKPCPANGGANGLNPGCNGYSQYYWGNYKGTVNYKNACATIQYTTNNTSRWINGRYSFLYMANQALVAPTDVDSGQIFTVDLQENYGVRNISSTAHRHFFLRKIKVPNGIRYTGSNPWIFNSNRDTLRWDSLKKTISIKFSNTAQPALRLSLLADCNFGGGGLGQFEDQLLLLPANACGPINCDTVLFSNICYRTIRVHCFNPCPRGGYYPKSLKLNRISYGAPDNNNDRLPDASGSINLSLIDRKRLMAGDTMEIESAGKIRRGSSSPSSPFIYGYGTLVFPSGTGNWYNGVRAVVMIKDTNNAGSSNTYTIGNLPLTKTNLTGNASLLRLNFSRSQLTAGGLPSTYEFGENDSLNIKFIVALGSNTPNGLDILPYGFTDSIYISHLPSPSNDTAKYSCDNYSGTYNLVGSYRFASQDGSGGIQVAGCNGGLFRFRTYLRHAHYYPYGLTFPYEYRPIQYPDTFFFDLPAGLAISRTQIRWYHSAGTFMDTITLTRRSGNRYFYAIRQLINGFGGTRHVSDEGDICDLEVTLISTCERTNTSLPAVNYGQYWSTARPQVTNWGNPQQFFTTNGSGAISFPIIDAVNIGASVQQLNNKTVSWDFRIQNNASSENSAFNWFKIRPRSIIVDSIQDLSNSSILTPISGVYRIGSLNAGANKSYRLFGRSTSCITDSITLSVGWDCRGNPTASAAYPCNVDSINLILQTASSAIQTQITPLAVTPSNPANGSSAHFGQSKIDMCTSFPVEIEVQNTQSASVFDVQTIVNLPTSGLNVGLDYVSDSGYIEYPIGSTPRPFSATANAVILSQVSSGYININLNQIDSANFSSIQGLPGTGTSSNSNNRRVKLRFKLRANCNLRSGSELTITQSAKTPCGTSAIGNNNVISAYQLDINGVTSVPYIAEVRMKSPLVGCGGDSATFKIIKIGNSIVNSGDSVRLFIPSLLGNSAIRCIGSNCPSNFPSFVTNPAIGGRELTLKIPSGLSNLDSLVFRTKLNTPNPNGCGVNLRLGCDVTRQLVIYCPTLGTNCPDAKQSLGNNNKFISVSKPDLNIIGFTGGYITGLPVQWKYYGGGTITNNGASVNIGDTTRIYYIFDINNNNTYEPNTDSLVYSKIYTNVISGGGNLVFRDTFVYGKLAPSLTRAMFAAIVSSSGSGNCNCASTSYSGSVLGLNSQTVKMNVTVKQCKANLEIVLPQTPSNSNIIYELFETLPNQQKNKIGTYLPHQFFNNILRIAVEQQNEDKIVYELIEKNIQLNTTQSIIKKAVYSTCSLSQLITVQPNPAQNDFVIKFHSYNREENIACQVYSIHGKKVFSLSNCNSGELRIATHSWDNGIYLININRNGQVITQKLVIQH